MDELPQDDLYQEQSTIWTLAGARVFLARSFNANTGIYFLFELFDSSNVNFLFSLQVNTVKSIALIRVGGGPRDRNWSKRGKKEGGYWDIKEEVGDRRKGSVNWEG